MHLFSEKRSTTNDRPAVVFFGTGDFAFPSLKELHRSGSYTITALITVPDNKVGRGGQSRSLADNAVVRYASEQSIPIFQPSTLKTPDVVHDIKRLAPDVMIVAAYGKLIPGEILSIAPHGAINVHPSLLPLFRGASPIQNAILRGETQTGVTIMQLDDGMDTGPLFAQETTSIDPDETAPQLQIRLAEIGATLLGKTLSKIIDGTLTTTAQDATKATLCELIERDDGHVQWMDDARSIYNRYRALTPWPGIFSFWKTGTDRQKRVKFIDAGVIPSDASLPHVACGTVVRTADGTIGIVAGKDILRIQSIQVEGSSALPIEDFVRGHTTFIGSTLL